MANNAVQIVIQAVDKASKEIQNVNKSLSEMDKNAGGSEKSISGIGSSLKGMVGTLSMAAGAAAAFGMAAKQAFDLGQEGASLLRLEEASGNLAASLGSNMDEVVSAVSKASLGMVSEMDIMQASSRAMMLGVSSDSAELANLMEIAASKARAMGISTTQAFNDIVTGIGRGSPLILDNLGIVVNATETNKAYAESIGKTADELTEAEKTQALLNSVLTEGNKQLEAVGGLVLDSAAAFEQFAANSKDAGDKLKKNLAPVIAEIVGGLNRMMFGLDGETTALLASADAIKNSGVSRQEMNAALRENIAGTDLSITAEGDLVRVHQEGYRTITELVAANYLYLDSVEALPTATDAVTEAQEKSNDVMAENLSNVEKLYRGHQIYTDMLNASAEAAAQAAIDNNDLAIALKDATQAQFASTLLRQIEGLQGISSDTKLAIMTDIADWGGLADDTSRALVDNVTTYLDNVAAGNIPLKDTEMILSDIYQGAQDGKPDVQIINDLFQKQSDILPELTKRLGHDEEVMTDLNDQLVPAVENSEQFYETWLNIQGLEHTQNFRIKVETEGGGGGVAFNQPNNTGTRPGMIGTAHGGEGTVPAGYNSDSFPIFTRSGEKVTVQTPPQKFETDQRYETIMAMLSAQRPATAAEIGIAVRDAIMMIPG